MSVPHPGPRPEGERPPSWAGAPGFTPGADDLAPHAPMPGAPPYPERPEPGPPPVGRRSRARLRPLVGVCTVLLVVAVGLVAAGGGARPVGVVAAALVGVTLLTALVVRLVGPRG